MFWFSLLGFVRPAIQIFLLPLYMLYLTPADYGLLALVGIFTTVITVLITLKLDASVRTFYFDYNDEPKKLWSYVSQMFSIIFLLGIVSFGVLTLLGPALFEWIFVSEKVDFYPFGILSLAAGLLSAFSTIYFLYLKNEVKVKEFISYVLSLVLLTLSLQFFFVVQLEWRVLGILYGHLIAAALIFIAIIFRNPSLFNFRFKKSMLAPSFSFALPLIPFAFLMTFEKQLDKLMIERFLDIEKVGLYAVLMSLIGSVSILLNAMNNAMRPFLYRALKENKPENTQQIDSFLIIYLLVGLIGLSGIIMIGNNLDILTSNEKYLSIRPYFYLAGLACIPLVLVRYFSLLFMYYKKSKELTIVAILKTTMMVVLMMILIPKYGIEGAIISVSISYVFNTIIYYVLGLRYGMQKLQVGKVIGYIFLFVLIVFGAKTIVLELSYSGLIQFFIVGIVFIPLSLPYLKHLASIKID